MFVYAMRPVVQRLFNRFDNQLCRVNGVWGVYIDPLLVDQGRVTKRICMFPGVRTQTQTRMFSVLCEMSLSTAAVSGLSAACSEHVVRQHRKLCHPFVDVRYPRYDEVATRSHAVSSFTPRHQFVPLAFTLNLTSCRRWTFNIVLRAHHSLLVFSNPSSISTDVLFGLLSLLPWGGPLRIHVVMFHYISRGSTSSNGAQTLQLLLRILLLSR